MPFAAGTIGKDIQEIVMNVQATNHSSLITSPQTGALAPHSAQAKNPLAPAKALELQPPSAAPSKSEVQEAATKAEEFVQSINSALQFSVDDSTGSTVVKVIDQLTNEVIRQIPSEEMLEIAKALDRISGLLVRNKA